MNIRSSNTYAILLRRPDPAIFDAATKLGHEGGFFKYSDTAFLLKSLHTANQISSKIGLENADSAAGCVLALGPEYYGWDSREFWNWMRRIHGE